MKCAFIRSVILGSAAVATLSGIAHAVPLSWDNDGVHNATFGGTGTWDLNTSAKWDDGTNPVVWSDSSSSGTDTAVFKGTAGTVTMNSTLSALGLSFQTTGYTVSGTGTLTLGASGIDNSSLSSGLTTLGVATSLAGTQTWNLGSGSTLKTTAAISGTGGITKSGSGTLQVTVTNSFNGTTTLNLGTVNNAALTSNVSNPLGTGQLIINGGTIANSATGGSSSFSLGNSSQTWGGDFALNNGSGGSPKLSLAGDITMTGSRIVSTSGNSGASAGITISGAIGESASGSNLTWGGNGGTRVFLSSAASTYTGATTITASTIIFTGNVLSGQNSAFGKASSDITLGAASGTVGSSMLVNAGNSTFDRSIVVQSGGTGGITIGTINSASNSGNGTLNLQGNLTLGHLTTGGRSITLHRANVSGNIADPVGLTGTPGTITINSVKAYNDNTESSFSTTLSGNNTFSGGVNLTNGTNGNANTATLVLNSATALGTGTLTIGAVSNSVAIDSTVTGGTALVNHNPLVLNGDFSYTGTQSLNMGDGAVSLGINAGATRTITTNGTTKTLTLEGVISNGTNVTTPTVNLTKAGTGLLTLSGDSVYTGNTTVSAGTLTLDTAGSLRFVLADGGGSNLITGAGAAVLNGALVADISAVTGAGSWTLVNVGTLNESWGGSFGVSLLGSASLASQGGGVYSASASGYTWTFDQGTGVLTAAVPEPASLSVVAMLGAMALRRRRAV